VREEVIELEIRKIGLGTDACPRRRALAPIVSFFHTAPFRPPVPPLGPRDCGLKTITFVAKSTERREDKKPFRV
jgi:hypothetical protein